MNLLTYVPEICSGDERKYEGSVTLRMPTFKERLEIRDQMSVTDENQGESAQLIKMLAHLEERLVSFEVRRLSDGFVINSFDVIQYDSELSDLITEACLKIVGKYQVGNGSTST